MPREGITYDQVATAADKITAEGQRATIRAIRDALGTGSPNTIQRHLAAWRAVHPQTTGVVPELPEALVHAIAAEIERAGARARADVETQLIEAQNEAAELAKAGETLEAERDELCDQVAQRTLERDLAQGAAAERAMEIQGLKQDLERERKLAEDAWREVATAVARAEAMTEKAAEMRAELESLKTALARSQQEAQARAVELATAQAQAEAAREAKDGALAGLAVERDRVRTLEALLTMEREAKDAAVEREAKARERAGIRQSSSDS